MGTLRALAEALDGQLVGNDRHYDAVCTDSRRLEPGGLIVARRGERFDGHRFVSQAAAQGAAGALVEYTVDSGVPQICVADARRALGRLAYLWRQRFPVPVVAVTGSNGKTTVKEMTATILREDGPVLATLGNLNNEIGLPLTLVGLRPEHHAAVVEMGANHAGEIADLTAIASPDVGVITNAGPAHLEGFGTVEGVARGKGELYAGLADEATAVLNQDDPFAGLWHELIEPRRCVSFGLAPGAQFCASEIHQSLRGEQPLLAFRLSSPLGEHTVELGMAGRHNVGNALAAAAAAWAAGAEARSILAGLQRTGPVAGRLQLRPGVRGTRLLDDTYNANPASLSSALEYLLELDGPCWMVLGDMLELGEGASEWHGQIGGEARRLGVERLYAMGQMSRHAADAVGPGARWCGELADLVRAVETELPSGANLLGKGSRGMRLERVVDALAKRPRRGAEAG